MLEIRKKSSLRSMKPETWLCRNVKRLTLVFLILQMSLKKRAYFISVSFARDFFFNIKFPPEASNLQSKIQLKSPPKIMFFCYNHEIFQVVLYSGESR